MRCFGRGQVPGQRVGDVDVSAWDGFDGLEVLPFKAMWYEVPPGRSSPRDIHPEHELSLVVSGVARVDVAGGAFEVPQGGAFLLDSDEWHVVHNPSETVPLLVFTTYWLGAGR